MQKISIIIQGKCCYKDINKTIKYIRKNIPNSEIIISTWENDSGLEKLNKNYDKLVLSKEIYNQYPSNGLPYICNFHRMMKTSYEGIKEASNDLVLRMRSDLVLSGKKFIKYYINKINTCDNVSYFKHKIMVLNSQWGFMFQDCFVPAPWHISDWLTFGYKEDLLKIWNGEDDIRDMHDEKIPDINFTNKSLLEYIIPSEVWLFRHFLHKEYIFSNPSLIECLKYDEFIKKNIIFIEPWKFKVKSSKYKSVTKNYRFSKLSRLDVHDKRGTYFFLKYMNIE